MKGTEIYLSIPTIFIIKDKVLILRVNQKYVPIQYISFGLQHRRKVHWRHYGKKRHHLEEAPTVA